MADYIKGIRTNMGDKRIDYEALAQKPSIAASGKTVELVGTVNFATDGGIKLEVDVPTQTITFNTGEIMSDIFIAGATAPENTKLLWIDTNATTGGLKYYNGTAWVHVPVAYN